MTGVEKTILIVGVSLAVIAIVTLIRYLTRTGVFRGRKNKDLKK